MKLAIIGGGAGGIAMGIAAARAGHDFTIFERAQELGGTWNANRYPGAGCDIPSHLYCFSFDRHPDWERVYARQPEIHQYFIRCAEMHGLAPHVRLGTEIASARFTGGGWELTTTGGERHAVDAIVSSTGQLAQPHVPTLPGSADFRGPQLHAARWDPTVELRDRTVAVIGAGATAVQLGPELARVARKVTLLQRTPPFVLPRKDHLYAGWQKWAFRHVPLAGRAYRAWIYLALEARFPAMRHGSWLGKLVHRLALRNLARQIRDPALRAKLTPAYPFGCKRIAISDDYYAALARPNVELVTAAIERVTADAIVTAEGTHAADVIVYATGFEATRFLAPMEIIGRDGSLAERWRTGAEAYHGITVAGFPNLFLLYGPNTNLGHNSIIFMLECQVHYVIRCLAELARRGAQCLEVQGDAMARYNADLQRALARTTWGTGCHNWYTTDGKITNNWAHRTTSYWWQTRRPVFAHYDFS